jgi:2-keto-4-pentenoate hydratase/2-oxohepta-3-ene-1,7-dioic acid hydratase in catechol pathway
MRWATFTTGGEDAERVGIVVGDSIRALSPGATLLGLLGDDGERLAAAGDEAMRDPDTVVAVDDVRLLAPIPRPPSVRDFMTFRQHVEAMTMAWDDPFPELFERLPAFYFSNPRALAGAHDPVPVPPGCRALDFELEIAAVIGRDGFDLTPEQAEEHVVGLCVMNDWSARDVQREEMQMHLGPAKGKDTATTLGPWLVTKDELESHRRGGLYDLEMTVAVNGREVGRDSAVNAHWSFAELAAYASRGTWLSAGDVLGSGTCGDGCIAEHRIRHGRDAAPWLAVGDEVTMEIAGIGRISNRIVGGQPLAPLRPDL